MRHTIRSTHLTFTIALLAASLGLALTALAQTSTAAASPQQKAIANIRSLAQAVNIYRVEWQKMPATIALTKDYLTLERVIGDPRLAAAAPAETKPANLSIDERCDFYYAGADIPYPAKKSTAEIILFYDKGAAGKSRIVAFLDGHTEVLEQGSDDFKKKVEAANALRTGTKLPADLKGPPK